MSELNENWEYVYNEIEASYNDEQAKKYTIDAAMDILGYEVEENPDGDGKAIDCRAKHNHNIGVEVEGSFWIGNFWENAGYNHLTDLPFKTVNMPIRKERYYVKSYKYRDKETGEIVTVENGEKRFLVEFLRWNWDGSQCIRVLASTVHDPEKMHKTKFKPRNKRSPGKEAFMSFRYEDSITYNKQEDGRMVSDREPGGKYVELSEDELKKQQHEVAVRRAEIAAENARKALELAKKKAEEEEERAKLGKWLNIVERREIARMTVPEFSGVLPKKKDLDKLGIPQYEAQVDEYYKKHPKIKT